MIELKINLCHKVSANDIEFIKEIIDLIILKRNDELKFVINYQLLL